MSTSHLLISIVFFICQCFSLNPFTNIRNRHLIISLTISSSLHSFPLTQKILKQIHVFLVDICNHFSLALPEDQRNKIDTLHGGNIKQSKSNTETMQKKKKPRNQEKMQVTKNQTQMSPLSMLPYDTPFPFRFRKKIQVLQINRDI